MAESRDVLRGTFEKVADSYDAARPAYPSELFDDLWSRSRACGAATGSQHVRRHWQSILHVARRAS